HIHAACGARLINLYGPTEATVDVSFYECNFDNIPRNIPIGKPIDNTRLYILDAAGSMVPIGVKGELHLAGVNLARGYLFNEELTNEKFIDGRAIGEERLYKTGDLARWLPDGNVEFLGRLDHQVKIGGLRIELGDLENQLLRHESIEECVVVVREKDEQKHLVAYYVAKEEIDLAELRAFLSTLVPVYMVPAFFVHLQEMPLSGNGKISRKMLPAPTIKVGTTYVAPAGQMEEDLVDMWSEILQLDKQVIGVQSNFFELGGSSLKLIELNTLLNERMQLDLTVAELFRYKTIGDLVAFLQEGDQSSEEYQREAEEEVSGMESGIDLLMNIQNNS
ncbi:MAG: non-ribosomal peptide synthetase, partial [Bacteroidota bacterium]